MQLGFLFLTGTSLEIASTVTKTKIYIAIKHVRKRRKTKETNSASTQTTVYCLLPTGAGDV